MYVWASVYVMITILCFVFVRESYPTIYGHLIISEQFK
jgi:hypothetical protein